MLCMLVGVGNAWGDEATFTLTSDGVSDYGWYVHTSGNATQGISSAATEGEIVFTPALNDKSKAAMYSTELRMYKNSTLNISTTSSNYKITKIVFTANGTWNDPTVTVGSYSSKTWTSADGETSVDFSFANGQARMNKVVVTYQEEGGLPSVETPTFSPSDGTYAEAQAVTIASSTEGATIFYSIDGGTTWNEYSSAITVSETTTIQAKATKDGYNESAVASATYTIEAPTTIAEARAQGTGSVFTKGVVTSGVGVTGYIQDATAAICVYGANLTVGDEITVSGTLSTYNGLLEITSPSVSVISSGNVVTPTVMTIAEINATSLQGWYVKIENATVTAIDGSNTTIAQGENTIVVRGISDVEYAVNDLLTLEGNIGCYNAAQIANPQNVEVQKSTEPAINAENLTLAYDATSGNITYTIDNAVEGTSLTATSEAEWISNITVGESAITFTTTANTGDERTGTITLTYGSLTKDITVTQSAYVDPNTPGASAENPYTVAQARAAIDAGTGITGVYATGIVSQIVTAYSSQYGNITYNISVDGTTTADQLQAYRGKSYNGDNFTSEDDIQVGDVVVIYGDLKKYNSTYEFDAGNQLVSLERPVNPIINASDVSITYDATSGEIAYTIDNTVAGVALEATTTADWISDIVVDAAVITFTTTVNEGAEDRTATITLTYGEVTKDVTVTQGHLAVDYAILPFSWSGGASADFNVLDGVTTNGLGSDYAASNAPYLIKLDGDGDYIMVKTDSRPGVVTIGVKMLGGANTSTITVQGSSDGETFTDVETLTISGAQNDILTLVTTNDFAETDRYVKLLFSKGSNVGVGPITIEKYTIKQDATIAFKKDGEVITALTANLNDMVEVAVECSVEGATLTYTSSNANVATYEDGVVLALAEGEATITATFAGNDEYKAVTTTLAVTVVDNRQEVTLAFSDVPAEINLNETATYAVTATPAVEGLSVTYSSSAPTVVSVDEATGEITALATGSATITATFAGNDEYKAAEASYTIAVVDPSFVASKYELVTDATTLKADDEIIIVDYEATGATYAISTNQKSANREATSVTVADDGTITPSADVAIITLGGETNAWTFYVTNGAAQGYLYASSSSQNQLKTEAEVDENGNANAKIEIANGAATVTFQGNYTRNIMQYNYNNGSPLFACYNAIADTRSLVSIYRKVASSETVPGDVNKDGSRTIADVTALVNIILGKATPESNPEYDFDAADVNGDGGVPTIADVTALVNIILGKE